VSRRSSPKACSSLDIEADGMVPWHSIETEARLNAAGFDPDKMEND
jgi:hypothetical protein